MKVNAYSLWINGKCQNVLGILREHPSWKNAQIIGKVTAENPGMVLLKTILGSTRLLEMLSGELLPRIC